MIQRYKLSNSFPSLRLLNPFKISLSSCDAGREGELIFRLLYNYLKCKKKVKRLWISSLEDSEILNGFNNLGDGKSKR